ncbi:DUF7000 family protein [Pseudochryseolinea flava]|uniref:DUF7000 domain-containing protein n=1 Tax=Pseudochryseolinea flava TaxID=2059302 RepID=A0A364XVQ5_9BACT|nr:hypothetical protein [Pseudochryseolinea flava]RAV98435.1 hypothetical protein DQQ10_24225 [Pseudochryseolinea flava]
MNTPPSKFSHHVAAYKAQLDKGDIQQAYAGLVKFVMRLGSTLEKKLAKHYAVGNLFQGYMDYTYFYYTNDFLKERKLKFGLVLNHSKMRFEIWLLGQTIPIQEKYWAFFKTTQWNEGRTTKPTYAILETSLIDAPNFDDLELLAKQIEKKLIIVSKAIIQDVKKSKLQ